MSFRTPVGKNISINRRRLIVGLGTGLVAAPAVIGRAFAHPPRWRTDPFSRGVASGAPRPDGFVLWTRLAPDPLSPDPATPGGMTGGDGPGTYEIASDPQMRAI